MTLTIHLLLHQKHYALVNYLMYTVGSKGCLWGHHWFPEIALLLVKFSSNEFILHMSYKILFLCRNIVVTRTGQSPLEEISQRYRVLLRRSGIITKVTLEVPLINRWISSMRVKSQIWNSNVGHIEFTDFSILQKLQVCSIAMFYLNNDNNKLLKEPRNWKIFNLNNYRSEKCKIPRVSSKEYSNTL